ncbi:succinate--CoA ligase subunit alpha [Desulfitibacter alkalitolerans]|uniref:succinate--CoA ligase subunit alpha n=1 Tax=Desulfitibacter alkalitolerans TaxID=264641 RepID=UPI000486D404|nr:succinate--CoA ligase subunit alpha [Desulfitibacter alkalitolerans]
MAILLNKESRVIIQGITGHQGSFHCKQMLDYGTNIIGGVSPGKGGTKIHDVPVYDSVSMVRQHQGSIDVSILFVPAAYARDAALEAIYNQVSMIVLITEHIPLKDAVIVMNAAQKKGATILGPNTYGIVSSGLSKVGIMPSQYFQPGPVGVVSRSGTLSYEIVGNLYKNGLGTSTVVGLGGDRITGLTFPEILEKFQKDEDTKAIVLIGEIGGTAEEDAAEYIKRHITKPVVAYLAGKSAPPGKRMGHAGAIIEKGMGTFEAKVKALENAGVFVASEPSQVPLIIRNNVPLGGL